MSYIPKYILKRLFPKDCVKKTTDGIEMTVVNVLSPLSVDEMPDNILDYFEILLDGEPVSTDILKKSKAIINDEKEYTLDNFKEFEGVVIPVGGTIKVVGPLDLNSGEEHTIRIVIKTDNPIEVEVTRTIQ